MKVNSLLRQSGSIPSASDDEILELVNAKDWETLDLHWVDQEDLIRLQVNPELIAQYSTWIYINQK